MSARLSWILMLPVLVGAARAAEPFDPFSRAGVDVRPNAQIPLDRPLRDADGRAVDLRELGHGKPILLVPVQHRCGNICGFTLDGLARAVNAQTQRPGADFAFVALGIDPGEQPSDARVTRQRLRADLAGHPVAGARAVVGNAPSIRAVTGALGYRYAWDPALNQYAHVAAAAVLTPDGRLSSWVYGVDPKPQVITAALGAASKGGLGAFGDRLLLLCYHYDPTTGRYAPLAWGLLRGGAMLVVLALVVWIGLSLWREQRRKHNGGLG